MTTQHASNVANQNAELVRQGYEAFNKADVEALMRLFDPDCAWHTPGRSFLAGDTQGLAATLSHFGRYGGETAGTFRAELKSVCAGDDSTVIAIHHNAGERNGKKLEVDCCIVFNVKDGRIVDGREHFFNLYAWDEFWS